MTTHRARLLAGVSVLVLTSLFVEGGVAQTASAAAASCPVGGGTVPIGWTLTGGVGGGVAATTAPFISPSGAATDCYIVTDTGGGFPGSISTGFNVSGVPGAPDIPDTTNGSVMTSPIFTAADGQAIGFDFSFMTNDGSFSDWAAAALLPVNATGAPVGPALNLFTARTDSNSVAVPGYGFTGFPAGLTLSPTTAALQGNTFYLDALTGGTASSDPNATQYGPTRYPYTGQPGGSTPWIDAQFTFDSSDAGTYELVMSTGNVGDTYVASGLLFTGLSLPGTLVPPPPPPPPPPPVPEPGALSLFGTALAGLGFARWRRRAGPPRADRADGEDDGAGPPIP